MRRTAAKRAHGRTKAEERMKRIAILRRTTIAAAATTAAFANDFDRTGWPESLTVGTGS